MPRAGLCASLMVMLAVMAAAIEAEAAEPAGRLGTQVETLGFPSAGRVVAGFALTVVIAVGAVFALRKAWPLLTTRPATSGSIRALSQAAISRTLTVHLIEVEGVRMVMVEGRSSVGIAVLGASGPRDSSA